MKTKKTKWKQYLAFMLAVVMTLTSTDLSMAASGRTGNAVTESVVENTESVVNQIQVLSEEGKESASQTEENQYVTIETKDGTSYIKTTEAALVASYYSALTSEEKAVLTSGALVGSDLEIPMPDENTTVGGEKLITVDADNKVVTAKAYTTTTTTGSYTWTPVAAKIVYTDENKEEKNAEVTKDEANSTDTVYVGKFTYAGENYSVSVTYEVTVGVAKETQEKLIAATGQLTETMEKLNTLINAEDDLGMVGLAIDTMFSKKDSDVKMVAFFDSLEKREEDVYNAMVALNGEYTKNNGSLNLEKFINSKYSSEETTTSGKFGILIDKREEQKEIVRDTYDKILKIKNSCDSGVINEANKADNDGTVQKFVKFINKVYNALEKVNVSENTEKKDDWTQIETICPALKSGLGTNQMKELSSLVESAMGNVHTGTISVDKDETVYTKTTDVTANVKQINVTISVKANYIDGEKVGSSELTTETYDSSVTFRTKEGITAKSLQDEIDSKKTALVKAAVDSWNEEGSVLAKYNIGTDKYTVTETTLTVDENGNVTKDVSYEITYTPKEYTVTINDEENNQSKTSYYYGYQLKLPEHIDSSLSYDYEISGKWYSQGKVYTVTDDVEITRNVGKAVESLRLNDIIADCYADELGKTAATILKYNALSSENLDVCIPEDLVSLSQNLDGTVTLTARTYGSRLRLDNGGELVWIPTSAVLELSDGQNTVSLEKSSDTTVYEYTIDKETAIEFNRVTVTYVLDLSEKVDKDEVRSILNLPGVLYAEADSQMAAMQTLTAENIVYRLGQLQNNYNNIKNAVKLVTKEDGTQDEDLIKEWENIDETCFKDKELILLNQIKSYQSENNGGLYYYSKNSADIKTQVDTLYDNLYKISTNTTFVEYLKNNGYEDNIATIENIVKELGNAKTALANLGNKLNVNKNVDLTGKDAKDLLDAIETAVKEKSKIPTFDSLPSKLVLTTEMNKTAANKVTISAQVKIEKNDGTIANYSDITTWTIPKGQTLSGYSIDIATELDKLQKSLEPSENYFSTYYTSNESGMPGTSDELNGDITVVRTLTPNEYTVNYVDAEDSKQTGAIGTIYVDRLTLELPGSGNPAGLYNYYYYTDAEKTNKVTVAENLKDTGSYTFKLDELQYFTETVTDNGDGTTTTTRTLTLYRETTDEYAKNRINLINQINQSLVNAGLYNKDNKALAALIPVEDANGGEQEGIFLRISPDSSGANIGTVVQNVAQAILSADFTSIGIKTGKNSDGEDIFEEIISSKDSLTVSIQALVDGLLQSEASLDSVINVIDEDGYLLNRKTLGTTSKIGDGLITQKLSVTVKEDGKEVTKEIEIYKEEMLGSPILTTTLELLDGTTGVSETVTLYITLEDFVEKGEGTTGNTNLKTMRQTLSSLKEILDVKCADGKLNLEVNLPDTIYDIYLTAMLLTGTSGITIQDMSKLSLNDSIDYALELLTDLICKDEFTYDVFVKTMKQVGQENISSSVTEDTYKTIKSLLKSLLENTTEDDGTRITEGDSYKTNVYDATLTYDVAEWVTSQGVNSTLLSMIKEYVSGTKEETAEDGTVTYTTTNKIPVSVPVKATSKNMEQTLQAWIVDMNASGMNKVHFVIAGIDDESGVSNLQAALKTAGEGAIVTILSNVTEDITISKSMTLNLNGKTITGSLTADGCTVTIVDSTLDTTGAGAITEGQGVEKALIATNDGAFKVTAGKYGEGVIDDSWLPEGYSQNSDGYVTNSLYSITVDEYGNITLNVLATFLDTSTVPDVTTMVQDLAYDLILNFYTAAAFQVTTSDGTYSIYTIDFDNALSLVNEVSSEGKSGLLNKVIGKISVDGVNALANELIKTLTDFKTLGTASGSSYVIGTYKLEQAAWDVNLSLKEDTSKKAESENEGSENEGSEKAKSENEGSKNTESENSKNYYVDLQIAPKTKTTQTTNTETGETTETKTYDWSSRTFKVQVVDPDANGTNMAELATLSNSLNDIVTIDDATKLSVTKITYENGDLQVTGDTDGRLATAKVTVNLAKDANYPQILAVVIADNAENISKDSKDALVAGIEGYQKSGDISALKKAIEGVTSAELFSALKNAKGKSFSQMLSDLGLTNADAEALEKTYDKMLNVLYVLINKLGLEGSGATLGSKKMQNKPGTYQVSGMKKRICAELTIQLFANGSVSAADTDGSVIYEGNNLAAAIAAANKVNGIVTVTSATTLTEDVTVTGKVSIIGAKLISYVGENTTYHHILLGNVNATVTADGSLSYTVKGESRSGVILPNTTDWQYYKVTETNKNGTYIYTMEVEDPTVRSTLTSSKVEVTVTNSKGEKTVIIKGASVDDANKRISLDLEPEKGITVEQFKTYIFKQVLAVNAEGYEVKLVNSNNKQLADGDSVGTGAKVVITATNKGDKNVTNDDKTVVATYTIIVMGDLNGNGRNDSGDASMLMQNYMNRIQLTDVQKIAGDINNTVGIDSGDAVRIMTKYMTWNKGTYQTNLK